MAKKCGTCYGYGLWAMGAPSPMGSMDARDGMATLPCPECGANANPDKVHSLIRCRDCGKMMSDAGGLLSPYCGECFTKRSESVRKKDFVPDDCERCDIDGTCGFEKCKCDCHVKRKDCIVRYGATDAEIAMWKRIAATFDEWDESCPHCGGDAEYEDNVSFDVEEWSCRCGEHFKVPVSIVRHKPRC